MAKVISAKEFVESAHERFTLAPPRKNAQGKLELVPSIDGKAVLIQFGTSDNPLTTKNGVVRYDSGANKYLNVDSGDAAWAVADRSGYYNKMTKKLQTEVRLSQWEEEGTEAYYAYQALKIIRDKVVSFIANGIPDGKGNLIKPMNDDDLTEATVRRMLTLPYQLPAEIPGEDGKFYPPTAKFKVRYYVKTPQGEVASAKADYTAAEMAAFKLSLDTHVFDGEAEKQSSNGAAAAAAERVPNAFEFFRGGAPGVYITQLNPIALKSKSEINMTADLKLAKFFERKSYLGGESFVDASGGSGGGENVGGFGTGGGEPAAKKAKTEEAPLFVS